MKVAIIGYGIDGKSAAAHWLAKGDEITVCDSKDFLADLPEGVVGKFGIDHMKNLDGFDVIVRSSGIRPQAIIDANGGHPEISDKITSGLIEFLQLCPSRNIIGVTGTKGKGTTCMLIKNMLAASGKTTHLCGNIGIAALDLLPEIKPDDFVVLELSSFQLIDCHEQISTAVCLMIAPEHLNWHADLQEYFDAKAQLFANQLPEDRVVYNANNQESSAIAGKSPATTRLPYDVPSENNQPTNKSGSYVMGDAIYFQSQEVMKTREVKLPGRHNLENLCAAIAAVWTFIGGNLGVIRQVAKSYSGLPHHTEYLAEIDGVTYINDSYSTMPDATIAALAAIPGRKVLILGGGSKNLAYDHMINAIEAADIRHIVLMGSLADEIADKLRANGINNLSFSQNGMADIIKEAQKFAEPGDTVLLSPGFPAKGDGFFIDNVDRGNQFKSLLGFAPADHH